MKLMVFCTYKRHGPYVMPYDVATCENDVELLSFVKYKKLKRIKTDIRMCGWTDFEKLQRYIIMNIQFIPIQRNVGIYYMT